MGVEAESANELMSRPAHKHQDHVEVSLRSNNMLSIVEFCTIILVINVGLQCGVEVAKGSSPSSCVEEQLAGVRRG